MPPTWKSLTHISSQTHVLAGMKEATGSLIQLLNVRMSFPVLCTKGKFSTETQQHGSEQSQPTGTMEGECDVSNGTDNYQSKYLWVFFFFSFHALPDDFNDLCVCTHISVCVRHVHTTCMHLSPLQVTVYDQENFQGKRLEFTSACQNIMDCGVDNIRSLKVECGA